MASSEASNSALAALIARAVVHLNFSEPDQAREVLLEALTELNFSQTVSRGEIHHGNAAA